MFVEFEGGYLNCHESFVFVVFYLLLHLGLLRYRQSNDGENYNKADDYLSPFQFSISPCLTAPLYGAHHRLRVTHMWRWRTSPLEKKLFLIPGNFSLVKNDIFSVLELKDDICRRIYNDSAIPNSSFIYNFCILSRIFNSTI